MSQSSTSIGILASHRGTNLQAIIDACGAGELNARVRVVISNNSDALALERARQVSIPAIHLSSRTHPDSNSLDLAILQSLTDFQVDLVVTAGYLRKLGPKTLHQFSRRIVNIHPSLLPRYGGRGMFGRRIHEAVLANGDAESGITVHYVDEEYDTGEIIAQTRIPVLPDDIPESLEARILEQEHRFLIRTLSRLIQQTA